MSALLFGEVLAALRAPSAGPATACAVVFAGERELSRRYGVSTLAKVHKALSEEYSEMAEGLLATRLLQAQTVDLVLASVELLAPAARLSRGQAAALYADCYLALSEWVVSWNRRQWRVLEGGKGATEAPPKARA